jgi:RNA polymerase sigma factor (sigma-70 family)
MMRNDPLANPEILIRRVYAYVAYRVHDRAEVEDIVSDVFERAIRYRASFDSSRGEPIQWVLGIARRCVDDARTAQAADLPLEELEPLSAQDLHGDVVRRLTLSAAIDELDERDRDLISLRYGADLTARQIGELLSLRTNAVEVALHRALARLRAAIGENDTGTFVRSVDPAPGVSGSS